MSKEVTERREENQTELKCDIEKDQDQEEIWTSVISE